ncbi:uncharacterized protein LOC107305050 [Oryza brachyantha]|uniref:uncharacterized protein LOC107305050 n=1 Tax=Oryza brachyantha TaxID=4533 RepID=UPI001AD955A6|nr:uncharacterized protein LOC107305050 [Oryza brachyantha]
MQHVRWRLRLRLCAAASTAPSSPITADRDLEELARGRAWERTTQWVAAHPHGGGGLGDRAPTDGAPGGGARGNGSPDGRRPAGGSPEYARHDGYPPGGGGRIYEERSPHRDFSPGGGWPTLTKTNYIKWAAVMRVRLQRTAKEAWDAIAAARFGNDRTRKSTLQALHKEWENLAFKPGEDIDDFALCLNTLLQKMVQYSDDTYNEERAVEKLFRCISEKYKQIARSIESLLDLSMMTIEEAIGRLKVVDGDEPQPLSEPITIGGKLHLTREQWEACQGDGKKGESSSVGGHKHRNLRKGRGVVQVRLRGRIQGGAHGGVQGGTTGNRRLTRDDACCNCGKSGHWAKDRRQPRQGQANAAQVEEEGPALLLAHASIELSSTAPAASAFLHLLEPKARALLGDGSNNDKTDGWVLDTGATHHMTGRREFFIELDPSVRGFVKFGNASGVDIKGTGSVIFTTKSGEHRLLTGVYYIPALRNSVISIGQLEEEEGSCVVIKNGVAQPVCLAARQDNEAWQWHERFGHLHFEALKWLSTKEMTSFRAKERLEFVHGDLCGPVTPATPGGRRFFWLLVDDLSRYMWVTVLGSKGEAADAIRHTQAAAEAEYGRKLRVLRIDNGGEFTAAEFTSYYADEGIHRHYSTPYSPQQNDVVERRNQTVVGMARALLKQRGMTPYEALHGRKPSVSHLRVFGCLAFTKELGHIGKLDDRSTPGVFIGYTEGSKAYRILDPETACAHGARRGVRRRARMDMGQDGGQRLYSNVRRLHCRVHPLQGSWGSGQLPFTERAYPSLRVSTNSGTRHFDSATLSSHDFGCVELFADTTTASDPTHFGANSHPSWHVHTNTSSRRA